MSIQNIGQSYAAHEVARAEDNKKTADKNTNSSQKKAASDSLEISTEGAMASKVGNAKSPAREAHIQQIKTDIENGTYITDEKLHSALDSAIDDALYGL